MVPRMVVCASTAGHSHWGELPEQWRCDPKNLCLSEGWGVIPQYESIFQAAQDVDIFAYLHDDVVIYENHWDKRVLREFKDPKVGLVGFGGALQHGSPDIYKRPYHITQLGRTEYFSNTDDAPDHGEICKDSMDVAVLDGFSLIVRRELLEKMGGWQPQKWPPHHVYDYRVSLEARRHGYRIRLVGVRCLHQGGRTAVSEGYQRWCEGTKWGSDVAMHEEGHKMIYEEYRDVLPWRVGTWV